MSEYFKLYNARANESICPHDCGNGLKLGEWLYPTSNTLKAAQWLIDSEEWSRYDPLFAVGDCGSVYSLTENSWPMIMNVEEVYVSSEEIWCPYTRTKIDSFKRTWTGDTEEPAFDTAIMPLAGQVYESHYPNSAYNRLEQQ